MFSMLVHFSICMVKIRDRFDLGKDIVNYNLERKCNVLKKQGENHLFYKIIREEVSASRQIHGGV